MRGLLYFSPIFTRLESQEEPSVFFSVNNGVLLCQQCGVKHQQLTPALSHLRPISADFWRPEHVECLRLGGNEKFLAFVGKYGIGDMD